MERIRITKADVADAYVRGDISVDAYRQLHKSLKLRKIKKGGFLFAYAMMALLIFAIIFSFLRGLLLYGGIYAGFCALCLWVSYAVATSSLSAQTARFNRVQDSLNLYLKYTGNNYKEKYVVSSDYSFDFLAKTEAVFILQKVSQCSESLIRTYLSDINVTPGSLAAELESVSEENWQKWKSDFFAKGNYLSAVFRYPEEFLNEILEAFERRGKMRPEWVQQIRAAADSAEAAKNKEGGSL